jgi:hypothetical protein
VLQKKILQERKMKNETEELLQLQQHPKNIAENKTKEKKKANMYKCRLQALRTFRAANCGALTA